MRNPEQLLEAEEEEEEEEEDLFVFNNTIERNFIVTHVSFVFGVFFLYQLLISWLLRRT